MCSRILARLRPFYTLIALTALALLFAIPTHGASLLAPVFFGMAAGQEVNSDVVRVLIAWGILDGAGGYKKKPVAKTADYTIISPATSAGDRSGTVFTNRGASGAVNFTLPAAAANIAGVWYEFLGAADQTFTVLTPVADTLTVVNDAAADSLAVSTASHKIGAHMTFFCDGTAWIAWGDSVGDTFTVAT